jgi:class 3 adenylate cyclase/tetratricopeptide (TPR) repeat protein
VQIGRYLLPVKISEWLESLGLSEYTTTFADNAIDTDVLADLSEADLEKIGVKLGHRKKLLRCIAAFVDGQLPTITPEEPYQHVYDLDENTVAWKRRPGERKPVTMLFSDIVGSTALTEKLDAEEAHDLLYGATQLMCGAVENNRGTLCRFMGDGVMAMFGAPIASEHHAVEACEAALAMQQAVRDYATNSDAIGLQIRIGLHSGEVVVLTVGDEGKNEYDASGPTVSIAARMEQAAAPGEVYITGATHSLAETRIEATKLEPVLVKGVSEQVSVFALRQVRSAEESAPNSDRSPFIGRRTELNQFRSMLNSCIEEGFGQTLYVRGEAGIGKTRLVEGFAGIANERDTSCHRGLVLPFGVGKGQDAIGSLVRSLLSIAPRSGQKERQTAVNTVLADGHLKSDQAVFLNDILDLPQPIEQRTIYDAMGNAARNQGKREVVSKLLTVMGNDQPILTIIEDVHWADATTLACLSDLTRAVAKCPALLVMTSRIDGDRLDREWLSSTEGSPFVTVELGPLRNQDSMALIEAFMDKNDALAKSCLARGAGNPLFLEQLMHNAQEGTANSIPSSIQSLVLARIDRLEPEDKRALQAASVVGQRFDVGALSHLIGTHEYDCNELIEHNLVRPVGAHYLFSHALIQESVYQSLLKRQRQVLHQKAAEWFTDSDLVLRAEHLGYSADEAAPEAFLEAAGEQAELYRIDHALELVSRGLEIAPEPSNIALRCLKGDLLRHLGSVKESIETFREAKEVATKDIENCRACIGIAEGLRITEDYDEMLEQLDVAEVIATSQALSVELAQIYKLRGNAYFNRGENEACFEASRLCLEYAREARSPALEAQALGNLADAEQARACMMSALDYARSCVELSREHGLGRILAPNLPVVALALYYQNEFEACLVHATEAFELADKIGDPRARMGPMLGLACRMADTLWANDLTKAKDIVNEACDIARNVGAELMEGWGQMCLARIALQEGQREEARRLSAVTLDLYRKTGIRTWEPMVLGIMAEATDDPDQHHSLLSEGEKIIGTSTGEACFYFFRDAMGACLHAEKWDEVDRFARALEDYTSAEPLPLTDFFIARGRALANFGRGIRDDETMQVLRHLRNEAERMGLNVALPALEEALSLN